MESKKTKDEELKNIQDQIAVLKLKQDNLSCSMQKTSHTKIICSLCKSTDIVIFIKTDTGIDAPLCNDCYFKIKNNKKYVSTCMDNYCPMCEGTDADVWIKTVGIICDDCYEDVKNT